MGYQSTTMLQPTSETTPTLPSTTTPSITTTTTPTTTSSTTYVVPPLVNEMVLLPSPHDKHHHHKNSPIVIEYMSTHPEWTPSNNPTQEYMLKFQQLQQDGKGINVDVGRNYFTTLMTNDKPKSKVKPDLIDIFDGNNITETMTEEDWKNTIQ